MFLKTVKLAVQSNHVIIVNSIASKHLNHTACVWDLACDGNTASNLSACTLPRSHLSGTRLLSEVIQ